MERAGRADGQGQSQPLWALTFDDQQCVGGDEPGRGHTSHLSGPHTSRPGPGSADDAEPAKAVANDSRRRRSGQALAVTLGLEHTRFLAQAVHGWGSQPPAHSGQERAHQVGRADSRELSCADPDGAVDVDGGSAHPAHDGVLQSVQRTDRRQRLIPFTDTEDQRGFGMTCPIREMKNSHAVDDELADIDF